jgi:outer membrane protein assembly factor BamB
VTDGKTLAVYFKSGTLAALDLAGKIQWQTNLVKAFGPDDLYWDQGSSPVITRDFVVFARIHGGDSWVAAFEKDTGKIRWKVPREFETAVEGDHGYNTPLVVEEGGKEALLIWGAHHLTAHETETGKTLWTCGNFNPSRASYWPSVASPVRVGNVAIVACGRADRSQPLLYGVRMGGSGDVTATHNLWKRDDIGAFVPTPAEYRGKVIVLRDRGEVEALEPETGNTVWKAAFPRSSGNFYASPVIANGLLYAIREDGDAFVARIEPSFELLAEHKFEDRIIATPVPLHGRLLVRGERYLYSFGAP